MHYWIQEGIARDARLSFGLISFISMQFMAMILLNFEFSTQTQVFGKFWIHHCELCHVTSLTASMIQKLLGFAFQTRSVLLNDVVQIEPF